MLGISLPLCVGLGYVGLAGRSWGYFPFLHTRATVGMMISQCPYPHPGGCQHWGDTLNAVCCFIYQTREFVSATIDHQPTCLFITWGRTLMQPFPLGQAEPLCFHAATVGGTCYRVEYGCSTEIKKATYNCPVTVPRFTGRGMCKWLHSVDRDDNEGDINCPRQSSQAETPQQIGLPNTNSHQG